MFDMDSVTGLIVDGCVRLSKYLPFKKWQKGDKLKILLVGYNGKRNTGADVRVKAMVDQFYHVLGKDNVEIGILTLDNKLTEVYFQPPTNLIEFSSIFFLPLLNACRDYHMAVLSEGSCLKSKFANALTLFFIEASGIMKKQEKPCIAYGSEAGYMDPFVKQMAASLCDDTYFIARTEPSLHIIKELGLEGKLGTDTAWTFPPGKKDWAIEHVKEQCGWDGKKPLLGLAVINPFWWPVKPSMVRFLKSFVTRNWEDNYEKYYFFTSSEERKTKFSHYLDSIAAAANGFVERHGVQPVIIGMEALDFDACHLLKAKLNVDAPVFSSKFYDGYQLTSILRQLSFLVTSRYHAKVLSMPGGVPAIAVSMDERLQNIFEESGHLADYYLEVDDPSLQTRLTAALEKLRENREQVREGILKTIPAYLEKMADMGETLYDMIREHFPDLKLKAKPKKWTQFLPPPYPELKQIMETYGAKKA